MSWFPLTKDLQAFLLRAMASLERVDNAVAEAHVLIREVRQTNQEARDIVAGIRAGLKEKL